jgi:N-acetylneuraminate synthase
MERPHKNMKRPLIIAEIGINHNGDLDLAKKLILLAKKNNFDCVKFQKRDIDIVYTKEYLSEKRESPWGDTQRHQKEGLEFGKKEYDEIDRFCKDINIDWFASAWDINSLKFLEQYNLKYNKIASAMIVDKSFLEAVAKQKIYTFISTGMSTEKNIDDAVEIFKKNKCEFELMHCVSTYPTKVTDVNLLTINALKRKYDCNVGYSGHENGVAISVGAFLLGISSLERHITLDRTMYGSDQSASIEEKGMYNLTESIDKIIDAMGEEKLGIIIDDELPIAKKLRAHIKN